MGIVKVTELLKTHPELKVYFIYEDKEKSLKTLSLNSFPLYILSIVHKLQKA